MSAQVGSWGIQEAAHEVRWDSKCNRDVVTLYLVHDVGVERSPASDQTLIGGFLDGLDPRSSHWHLKPKSRTKRNPST